MTLCVPAWIALAQLVPVLAQMPGVVVLAAFAVTAATLARGPAILAVAIGTIAHELIRTPVPPLLHAQRMAIVAAVGGVCVALAYGRTARQLAAERYRVLFDRHPMPMVVFDEDTMAFISVNEASQRIYGYSEQEFLRMTLRDIRPQDEMPLLETRPWAGKDEVTLVTRHTTKSGQELDVKIRSQRVTYPGRAARMALVENITEQRILEAQLRQAQKMEAIGQLAGGVAHDFNNLLTAIRGYASLVLDSLPEGDPLREDVLEIERAGERATSLTRQLLAFSRKQILQERVLSPNEVVTQLAPMLARLVGEDVKLRTLLRAEGYVQADPSQLEQVLMNLVVNGRDALENGGEITIETADVELDDLYTRGHPIARSGPHVMLAVSDNGRGMSAEVQARAFEPFFTTKAAGKGTGLGLATVYGIVKQSGGHVLIYSEVGRGTTVKVYLQRTDAAPSAPGVDRVGALALSPHRSVLLVEDEQGVRALLEKVLARAGYAVLSAATREDVRQLLDQAHFTPDLLITDVVLSAGSGREVAASVTAAHPACRVLYISGYTDDAVVRHGILTEQMPFLQKPFSASALLTKVAEALRPSE